MADGLISDALTEKMSLLEAEKAHILKELSEYDNLIFLCGHYEGVDQRVLDEIVDEEISIGDYVVTGGEIPACMEEAAPWRQGNDYGQNPTRILLCFSTSRPRAAH